MCKKDDEVEEEENEDEEEGDGDEDDEDEDEDEDYNGETTDRFQVVVRGRAGFCALASITPNVFGTYGDACVAAVEAGYVDGDFKVLPLDARLDITQFDSIKENV